MCARHNVPTIYLNEEVCDMSQLGYSKAKGSSKLCGSLPFHGMSKSAAPDSHRFCDSEAADVGYGTQSSTSSEGELWRKTRFGGSGRRPAGAAMSVRSAESGGGGDSVMSLASTASGGSERDDDGGSCSSDSLAALSSLSSRRSARVRHSAFTAGHRVEDESPLSARGSGDDCSESSRSRGCRGALSTVSAAAARLEVPVPARASQLDRRAVFVGREWAFEQVDWALRVPDCRGVLILGAPGTGKTAFLEQLYQLSPFGDGRGGTIQNRDVLVCLHRTLENNRMHYSNSQASSPAGTLMRAAAADGCSGDHVAGACASTAELAGERQASLRRVASLVVARHTCCVEDAASCSPAELVRNIAAQLVRAPRLAAYRRALQHGDTKLREALSEEECARDPFATFARAVVEPLIALREKGIVDGDSLVVLVDGVGDAELHRPDGGADSIASFLTRAVAKYSQILKFIISTRPSLLDVVAPLNFFAVSLDTTSTATGRTVQIGEHNAPCIPDGEGACRDVMEYITYRIYTSDRLRANICLGSSAGDGSAFQMKACQHLQTLSHGCFLYCKLILDLIEQGQLVLKTANFKIVPVNLNEVFLLNMNLKFPGLRAFERAQPILNVCLASLRPLSLTDIYLNLNASYVDTCVAWEDFLQRIDTLSGLLMESGDGTLSFFHPAFREWLARRDEGQSIKFVCDVKAGHACIALRMTRGEFPLVGVKVVELGHHILKAHLFKSPSMPAPPGSCRLPLPGELQAYWMALAVDEPTSGLACVANLFSPNVQVSRLMLLSGASAKGRTEYYSRSPLLCVAAREGFTDVMNMLLEFGADIDGVAADGQTPLCHAAARGQLNAVKMLCDRRAQVAYLDNAGRCALIHAALHGHLEVVKFLVNCAVRCTSAIRSQQQQREVVESAVVAAATRGQPEVVEFLLDTMAESGFGSSCNSLDCAAGETALTAACLYGRKSAAELLISRGADVRKPNGKSFTPLLCAAKCGHCNTAEAVLCAAPGAIDDSDKHGRTALAIAAAEGHSDLVDLLLDRGIVVDAEDKEGLTALSWACLKGHARVARALLNQNANVDQADRSGRTALDHAVICGDAELVHLLVEKGASTERADASGARPLDRAIERRHLAAARCLLRRGAKLTPATWAAAGHDAGAMHLLLSKLLDDGSALYRKGRTKEAAARYQYALKHFSSMDECDKADSGAAEVAVAEAAGDKSRRQEFDELKHSALVNLSKCLRKLGDYSGAVDLATAALLQQPGTGVSAAAYEAYCARARARRDARQYELALEDLAAAAALSHPPANRDLRRLLVRVREECKQQARLSASAGAGDSTSSLDEGAGDGDEADGGSLCISTTAAVLPTRRRAEETAL